MTINFLYDSSTNQCNIGAKVLLTGWIRGENNVVIVEDPLHECTLDIRISGNGNRITLRKPFSVKGLSIRVGNHVPTHASELLINDEFSIESGGNFLLYNSGNKLHIGSKCMFSNTITVRCGDSPHLIFDQITGEYLDISEGVFIGDHVWVGERVYITKRANIPSECLIAACSVVTKKFTKTNTVMAGNPAKIVRENVQWIRNHSHLKDGSPYKISYQKCLDKYKDQTGKP